MKHQNIILAFALMLPSFSSKSQGFIYDQQSATSAAAVGGAAYMQQNAPLGQSFTPTLGGIAFVMFAFYDINLDNNLGATIHVNLHSDGITGSLLGTTESISMADNYGRFGSDAGVTTFFFASTIDLQPGTIYYLEPVVESGDQWAIRGSEFGYAGGTAFLNGLPIGSDTWFREGMLVPEPSAFAVVLLGAGVLAWFPRARKVAEAAAWN